MNAIRKNASRDALFFIMVCLCGIGDAARTYDIRFKHLTINEGLLQNSPTSIIQDAKGFMWIGSEGGINKYDGLRMHPYEYSINNPDGLSGSYILSMYTTRDGTIWIGTDSRGLNRYDYEKDAFIHYFHDPRNGNSLINDRVYTICETGDGELWIGTEGGLDRFDRADNTFIHYRNDPNDSFSIGCNKIRTLVEGNDGGLWIGTDGGGLNKFDRKENRFSRYRNTVNDQTSLSNNNVTSLLIDASGTLWVGTYGGGINLLDPDGRRFTRLADGPADKNSVVGNNYINALCKDSKGSIWIGSNDNGLALYDGAAGTFRRYSHNPGIPSTISGNRVLSICEDRDGGMWIGVKGGGVNYYNGKAHNFRHYARAVGLRNGLNSNSIWQICEDRLGLLWIGTDEGCHCFDRKTNIFTVYKHDPGDPAGISFNQVISVYEDSEGFLWMGTNGGGLNKFDRAKRAFFRFRHVPGDSSSIGDDRVVWIAEDREGYLWLGTKSDGVNKIDRKTGKRVGHGTTPAESIAPKSGRVNYILQARSGAIWIATLGDGLYIYDGDGARCTHFTSIPADPAALSSNSIFCVLEDKAGFFWIGTIGAGLNKYDPKANRFYRYSKENGMPDLTVYRILEDGNGCLWLSHNKGISRFNPVRGEFRNYTVDDGLQSNEFNQSSACLTVSGELFFGGINGFNSFFPDSLAGNAIAPAVVITGFQIFNRPVRIGDMGSGQRAILTKNILETGKIVLYYSDNFFTLEFSALNYLFPEKNQYAYFLENYDRDWNYIGNRHSASYTGLPPGDYLFRVKASNNDGVWNENGAKLKIVITPPFWKTWWFSLIAAVLLFCLATGMTKSFVDKRQKRRDERERRRLIETFNDVLRQGNAVVYRRNFKRNEFEYLGSAVEKITGYSADELTPEVFDASIVAMEVKGALAGLSAAEATERFRNGSAERWISDTLLKTKNGDARWVMDLSTHVDDAAGQSAGCLGIFIDITDRKQAEQKLALTTRDLSGKNHEMEKDLDMARQVQLLMLTQNYPKLFPPDAHGAKNRIAAFAHRYIPTRRLAGDFFEIFPIDDETVGMLLCDVMGHGVRASLFTTYFHGLIGESLSIAPDPSVFLERLNKSLLKLQTGMFASAFYCVVNVNEGAMRYINAGHPWPFIVNLDTKEARELKAAGTKSEPSLGLLADYRYPVKEYSLSVNDVLLCYTDGLYEVFDRKGGILGIKRLFNLMREIGTSSPERIMDELLRKVCLFSGSDEFSDDVCMVTLHLKEFRETK